MSTRRDFLKWNLALGGSALALQLGARRPPRGLPEPQRAKRVLEVFLYGGLSQWETLYFVDQYGKADDPLHPNQQFYTFESDRGSSSVRANLERCGLSATLGSPFATDALGAAVQLGPFSQPLWSRSDVTDRMRLLVQAHDLEPHEAAIPLALTGRRLGSGTLAGLGAHVQTHFQELGDGSRRSPLSYVLSTNDVPGDNVKTALAVGQHPGSSRPLHLKIDGLAVLERVLGRRSIGATTAQRRRHDKLVAHYIDEYRRRLIFPGAAAPQRSRALAALEQSAKYAADSEVIASVLDPALFRPRDGSSCGVSGEAGLDIPGMSYQMAAHLLTHPIEPAKYVCLVDTGLITAAGGGGYDTHEDNSRDTAINFNNTLKHLLGIINRPGENDSTKLNLDDTLIVLNTEFGRTPTRQEPGSTGRNHFPFGYVTALIGGPIRAGAKTIVGALGPDGRAQGGVTPVENRIGVLLAMGVKPFRREAFSAADVDPGAYEDEAAAHVAEKVLGVAE